MIHCPIGRHVLEALKAPLVGWFSVGCLYTASMVNAGVVASAIAGVEGGMG